MVLLSMILDFASETTVLLFSGCVSLVTVSGICAGVAFAIFKHIKHLRPENKINAQFHSEKCVSEEPIFSEKKSQELTSQPESNSSLTEEHHQGSSVLKSDELGNTKNLKNLKDYLRITVASSIPKSTYDKDGEIREFLEHLVGTLISENLDDVPLTPLSDDEQYTSIFSKYHPKLSAILTTLSASLHSNKDSESLDDAVRPSTLYGQLKSVVQEVQDQAALLPPLPDYAAEFGPGSIESRLEGQSYEDILTTAVLNKIISRSQSNEPSATRNINLDTTTDFNVVKNNICPTSSPKEKFSLLVEEHIEEVTTRYQVSDDEPDSIIESSTNYNLIGKHRAQFPELGKDVVDGYNSCDEDSVTEIVSNVDSWEDNWLFQRRKKDKRKKIAISQVSVPMLVPNPSEKYRALIGEVDVDETSDLSECSDSVVEELTEAFPKHSNGSSKMNYMYKYDFNSSLETPTFKSDLDNESEGFAGDHDQDSSGVTSISRDISDAFSCSSMSPYRSDDESLPWTSGIREAKNENILLGQVDSGEGSLETQPENEYLNAEESNLSVPEEPTTCETYNLHNTAKLLNNDNNSSPLEDLATPPKPGTIAEREHRKWEHAAPIPNNPYTKENIEKRNLDSILPKNCVISTISDQYERTIHEDTMNGAVSLNDISKYERDYYVNTADKNKKSEENETERRTRSVSREENPTQNGFGITPILSSESPEKRNPNLVRVSSWSDRKKPDVEVRKRLPSVKELAKQFSGQNNSHEEKKFPATKNQMVHSLTARSMCKQFREGLKNNIGKTFNRNIVSNGNDEFNKLEENGHAEDAVGLRIHNTAGTAIIY